jgi:hypothetical protein
MPPKIAFEQAYGFSLLRLPLYSGRLAPAHSATPRRLSMREHRWRFRTHGDHDGCVNG